MAPRYRVTLTVEERAELKALTRAATKTTGKRFLYARALLLCDRGPEGPGWTVARVAEALGVSARTIEHFGVLWSRGWSLPWSASGGCGRRGK